MALAPSSSRSESRHIGQDECADSHVSMQWTWKPWRHLGSKRTASPSANSPRQMAHSAPPAAGAPGASVPYTATGIFLSTLFFSPAPAAGGCGSAVGAAEAEGATAAAAVLERAPEQGVETEHADDRAEHRGQDDAGVRVDDEAARGSTADPSIGSQLALARRHGQPRQCRVRCGGR